MRDGRWRCAPDAPAGNVRAPVENVRALGKDVEKRSPRRIFEAALSARVQFDGIEIRRDPLRAAQRPGVRRHDGHGIREHLPECRRRRPCRVAIARRIVGLYDDRGIRSRGKDHGAALRGAARNQPGRPVSGRALARKNQRLIAGCYFQFCVIARAVNPVRLPIEAMRGKHNPNFRNFEP